MVYASIWDFRFNHVPLPRGTNGQLGYSYSAAAAAEDGFWGAVATRKAGWGLDAGFAQGAPFDATAFGHGSGGAGGAGGARMAGAGRHRGDDIV